MNALPAILASEKGLLSVLLIAAATVLAALGRMSTDQWIGFVEIIFGTYVAGKTIQGVATVAASRAVVKPAEPTVSTTTIVNQPVA